MSRRRRLDQDLIAKLYTENHNLTTELAYVRDLLSRRTDALLATEREKEALHHALKELGKELHPVRGAKPPQGRHTAPMARQRSLTPAPVIDLTQDSDETELMMRPGWDMPAAR